jgi:ribosomal protein S18 acetylase RimI-like enzyme
MPISIRQADIADALGIARVQVDTWRTTYTGILPDQVLSNMSYERGQQNWEREMRRQAQGAIFVAEDESGLTVGFAACGQERTNDPEYKGELYAIYVLKQAQGKGIGKQLALASAKHLKERNFSSMLVWVLEENPYRRFYESIGGVKVRDREAEFGGKKLRELGYGWSDLARLVEQLQED